MAANPVPALLIALIGLELAFWGWKIHEGFIKVFGFLIGFVVGGGGTLVLLAGGPGGAGGSIEGALLTTLLMAVLLGVVSAYVAIAAERLFVSVTGLLVAMGVPHLYSVIAGSPLFAYLSLPLGVVGAYVAWKSYKGMVILMTAVLGGGLVAVGASLIDGGLGIASFVLTTTVGAGYQLSGVSVDGGEVGRAAGKRAGRSVKSLVREFWAPIVYLFILLPFLISFVVFVDLAVPSSLQLTLLATGPPVLAAVNTVRGGSLRSSLTVGVVPGIWVVLAQLVSHFSRLIRYRQCYAGGWATSACRNNVPTNEPVLSVDPSFILFPLSVGLGLAVAGILLGMGYNRFVGPTSDGAAAG